jgi:putative phosphoesterase
MNMQSTSLKCSLNNSYCKFGAQTLLTLLDGIDELIDGVMENLDVECVHKTRVASRRLRAALPLFGFCFSKQEFKIWRKEIKNVTRLLAQARDLDVQIISVQQYIKKMDPKVDKTCLNLLLKDHRSSRKNIQGDVDDGLNELQATQTLTNIQAACQQIIAQQLNQTFDVGQVLEKAHWNISFRLNDFLSMKQYVHMENEKLKHHQMRIYAKKLRYTMECFSPLYGDHLEKEIEKIKSFQDLLGEMHDCDVWLDFIPNFNQKIKNKAKKRSPQSTLDRSLQDFSTYIQARRKKYYTEFVEQWEKTVKNDFFDQLTDKTSSKILALSEEKAKQALAKPHVKIAVISDVHANLQALQKVIADAEERGADVFLNAGDLIGFGACPNEVVELLCEKNVLSIVGNYDVEVLEGKSDAKGEKKVAFKYAKKELSRPSECYLQMLPHEIRLEVAGKRLLVTHGSPKSINEHIYHDTPLEHLKELENAAKADVVIIGHSHEQFQRRANGTYFVNPGSVGRPGDGNPQAGYAILSLDPFEVELIRADYDLEGAAYALRKKGLPESFAQMLLQGVPIDQVVDEDKAKEASMDQNCGLAIEDSQRFSEKLLPDTDHYQQVTSLSLALFDALADLHKLGKRERCLLQCASLLHDVGLSRGGGKHHKTSMQMILDDTQLPFASTDRRVIASLARYHRKGLPKFKHYNLASLDRKTVHTICVLSALLRIADSLDYSHKSSVKVLGVNVGTKKITVECITKEDLTLEEQIFNKKKDLFEKVFKKKTGLVWKQQ